ncbi:hypothetical protein [Cyclobacterium xiamenense]|uniref:hypothetical protein n=1 Tax=Cyclobacterium xiamenense TaxID=1297121 RepID=UPI0035D04B59
MSHPYDTIIGNEMVERKKYDKLTGRKIFGDFPKYDLITTHSCRRSFATNYHKIIPTPVLMEITGHSRESTFLAYIHKPR